MLKFTVEGQKLELIGDPFVVADSFDYLTGEFRFYSGYDWDLTEKHVFFQLGEGTPYEVVLVDNKFVKTDHVNLTTGTWSIYVIGYDIDGATLVERITTNKVSLTVDASGVQDGEPFPPSIIPDILVTVDQSTPQRFVGGIPKLAADREISDDNDLVDKKHVADTALQIDQTTPQTIANGVPSLNSAPTDPKHITNKEYVDQYALGGSGFAANLYFTTIDSAVAGYKKISYLAEASETELTIPVTTTEALARTYLYDDGLGVTVIDGGKWSATYRAKVSSAQGAAIRLVAFLRHTDNTETTLFSASSDKIVNTTYQTLDFQITQPSFECLTTDRIGFKMYASTTHPAGVTLNTIVGDGNASYANTPIALRHGQLRDLNGGADYQHMTAAQISALHAHSNKTALDAVSGINTGDQSASGFNHNDLSNKQGGTSGEYYHTTQAQNAALHAHSNKAALDAVSGTNTGDQTLPTRDSLGLDTDDTVTFANLSGMNTGDQDAAGVANTPAGNIAATTVQAAINELDAEKEAVANKVTSISETSTDTQYPSAKCTYGAISTHNSDASAHSTQIEAAISTHNANTSAHADKEKTSNKVTSITSASTDTQYPSAKCVYAALNEKHYTFRWDKVNALGVRLNNAQGISTTITNFCHRGTINAAMDNPFDSIYPWKDRNVCNISIDAYRALSSGASLRDCVISWLGDPDFDYAHANGAWVYTPEFWYKVWDEGGYRYFDISPIAITGYIHAPETIEGRWHGGIYELTVDGTSKSCLLPKPGMPGKRAEISTLHTYAKNWGASIENIYGYSATDVLMIVEFATMNTQTAIGDGVSNLFYQSSDTIQAAATASATVKVLTAAAENCIAGSIFDIGTTNEAADIGSFIIASTALDADPTYTIVTLTTDRATPASATVTTDHMWSVRGLSNTVDASIGAGSGYIGVNGKCHAYYRGQVAHANLFRYVLGAYRQTGTGKIWIANNPAEADAYDALNTTVHKDTGLVLPQGAEGAAIGDYIGSLHLCPDVPAAPFCESTGGSNANPVGDYCYVPTIAKENTILIAGGPANYRTHCGRFYGHWDVSAAALHWRYGAVPVLKTPV